MDEDQSVHDENSRQKKINDFLCPLEGHQRTGHENDKSYPVQVNHLSFTTFTYMQNKGAIKYCSNSRSEVS